MRDKEYTFPAGAEVSIIPVMQGEGMQKVDESTLPDILPVLALRNAILFPGTIFVMHFLTKEISHGCHHVFRHNITAADFKSSLAMRNGIVSRSNDRIMAELPVRDKETVGIFHGWARLLIIKFNAIGFLGIIRTFLRKFSRLMFGIR